jgi:hypothetical protein
VTANSGAETGLGGNRLFGCIFGLAAPATITAVEFFSAID